MCLIQLHSLFSLVQKKLELRKHFHLCLKCGFMWFLHLFLHKQFANLKRKIPVAMATPHVTRHLATEPCDWLVKTPPPPRSLLRSSQQRDVIRSLDFDRDASKNELLTHRMNRGGSSPEEGQAFAMTERPPSRNNMEATMEEVEAHSPLNEKIPKLPTENVQPLIASFLDKMENSDVTDHESRRVGAQMFLELIGAISEHILAAFRNMALESAETLLRVSEQAVQRAVLQSLRDSFQAALGSSHPSMSDVPRCVSEEVLHCVNAALSCSQVKDNTLLIPEDVSYSPPKDKMKAMVRHVKTMLSSVKHRVRPGHQDQQEEDSPRAADQIQLTPRQPRSSNKQLRRSCFPCSTQELSDEEQDVTSEGPTPSLQQDSSASSTSLRKSAQRSELEHPVLSIQTEENVALLESLTSSPVPTGSAKAPSTAEEQLEEQQEQTPSSKQKRRMSLLHSSSGDHSEHEPSESETAEPARASTKLRSPWTRRCLMCCGAAEKATETVSVCSQKATDSVSVCSQRATDSVSVCSRGEISRVDSPEMEYVTERVTEILQMEAMQLSNEDGQSLTKLSRDTASSIVSQLRETMSTDSPAFEAQSSIHSPKCLTGVKDTLKSFFALCKARVSLRASLKRLCLRAQSTVSLEEVMEQTSPVLQELLEENGDVYETIQTSVKCGERSVLSEKLSEVISTNMATAKVRPQFKREVRVEVNNLMCTMCRWLQAQTQLPAFKNPVHRAMGRIRKLIFKVFLPHKTQQNLMLPSTEQGLRPDSAQPPTFTAPSAQLHEPVLFRELEAEAPVHPTPVRRRQQHTAPVCRTQELTAPVLTAPVQRTPLPGQWTNTDLNALVGKVVSRIFCKKWSPENPEMVALSRFLLQQLKEKLPEWDVQEKPSRYKDVADAVYKDLRRNTKRRNVVHSAVVDSDYRSNIVETIQLYLEVPQRRTLCSRLRSVCRFFCWPI